MSAPVMAADCSFYSAGVSNTVLNTTNVVLNSANADDCAGSMPFRVEREGFS